MKTMNSAVGACVRHPIGPGRAKVVEAVQSRRTILTDLKMMKPMLKKKVNPAFKRLQALPVLPDLASRSVDWKNFAAAPAVVIALPPPEVAPDCQTKTF